MLEDFFFVDEKPENADLLSEVYESINPTQVTQALVNTGPVRPCIRRRTRCRAGIWPKN